MDPTNGQELEGTEALSPSLKDRRLRLARNVASNWLWFVVVLVFGFIIPPLINRQLGKELLGVWQLSWLIVFYIGLLALGTGSAVSAHVARFRTLGDWESLNSTVNSALAFLMCCSAAGLIAAGAFAALVHHFLPGSSASVVHQARWVVFLLAASGAIELSGGAFNAVITGYERFDLMNLVRGGRDVAQLIVLVSLLLCGSGLVGLAAAYITIELLGMAAKIWAAQVLCPRLRYGPRWIGLKTTREIVIFGSKTVLQSLARSGLYQVNGILVSSALGVKALAVYGIQRALVMYLLKFVKQYAQVFAPTGSSLQAEGRVSQLRGLAIDGTKYGFLIALPVCWMLTIMGGPLVRLWMGSDYEAPLVLGIMAVAHALYVPQLGLLSLLIGLGRHGRPALYDSLAAGVSVAITALLLWRTDLGMIGAALGMAFPLVLSGGVLLPAYACSVLNLSMVRYVRHAVAPPFAATLPLCGILLAARVLLPDRPITGLAVGTIGGMIPTAWIYWRSFLPQTIKARITQRLTAFFPPERINRDAHPDAGHRWDMEK